MAVKVGLFDAPVSLVVEKTGQFWTVTIRAPSRSRKPLRLAEDFLRRLAGLRRLSRDFILSFNIQKRIFDQHNLECEPTKIKLLQQ